LLGSLSPNVNASCRWTDSRAARCHVPMMFVIALGTYAIVDIRIHLIVEFQGERIEGGEGVGPVTPSVAPRTATFHGTLGVRHQEK